MLRTTEEKKLDRTFAKIETWEEFLACWEKIDTEQEAVGLLYANNGLSLSIAADTTDRAKETEKRVKFLIQWSSHSNITVATAAQQVIVKHWLKNVALWSEYIETHRLLLNFLLYPRESLLKPPYPRFVSKYLLGVYEVSRHGDRYFSKEANKALHDALMELSIKNLIVWGLSYRLASDGFKEAIPHIKKFLDERNYNPGMALLKISGNGEPLSDLSYGNIQEEINEKAALAFLKLCYWVGGGVNETFQLDALCKMLNVLK